MIVNLKRAFRVEVATCYSSALRPHSLDLVWSMRSRPGARTPRYTGYDRSWAGDSRR